MRLYIATYPHYFKTLNFFQTFQILPNKRLVISYDFGRLLECGFHEDIDNSFSLNFLQDSGFVFMFWNNLTVFCDLLNKFSLFK